MKKAANFQNTFGGGGRIKVIAAITYLLNERGIILDWISFRNTLSKSMMEQIISKPLKVNFITLKYFVKVMSEYKYIKINRIIENLSKDYHLVINFNNTISGFKNDNNYNHYCHFPREARLIQKYNNEMIHNPLFAQLFRRMYLQRLPVSGLKGIFLANSKFTKGAMNLVYPLNNVQVEVLYPPVIGSVIVDNGLQSVIIYCLPDFDLDYWSRYNYCQAEFYPAIDPATLSYQRLRVLLLNVIQLIKPNRVIGQYIQRLHRQKTPLNYLRSSLVKYQALKKLNRI